MSRRETVYSALANDAGLAALHLPADSIMAAGSVDTPELRPFVVLRWGSTTPGYSSDVQLLDVWCHDQPADYTQIDRILSGIKAVLLSLSGSVSLTDGSWITAVDWTGDGDDDADETYNTIFRTSSFRVVGAG